MTRLLFIGLFILRVTFTTAQEDITGDWYGALNAQGKQYRLVLHIARTDSGYSATMDSPDQGAKGIQVTTITFKDQVLKFEISSIQGKYNGRFAGGVFRGNWTQGPSTLSLNFQREEIARQVAKRPQEPVKPYPYEEEEVTFVNKEFEITLAGTLTKPKTAGPHPVVVMISGSGAQNRNEELAGHKPFLVIADYLTRRGIAVLRYDDRGTAKSEGNYAIATTQDLATDVNSAVTYLSSRQDIDQQNIGLMGHSEGGIIAPIVAAENDKVAFIVLLAGTGIPGDELLLMQSRAIASAQGASGPILERSMEINAGIFGLVKNHTNQDTLKAKLKAYILAEVPTAFRPVGMSEDEFVATQTSTILSPWMQYFIRYNPALILPEVQCPVLAVNGDKDLQVPSEANLSAIKAGLEKGGNQAVTTIEYPNLNHLFQTTETGNPDEYGKLEETFSEKVLEDVTAWIKKVLK